MRFGKLSDIWCSICCSCLPLPCASSSCYILVLDVLRPVGRSVGRPERGGGAAAAGRIDQRLIWEGVGVQSCDEDRPTWLLLLCVKKQMDSKQNVPPVRRLRRVRCESTGEL